jgi:phospholipase C
VKKNKTKNLDCPCLKKQRAMLSAALALAASVLSASLESDFHALKATIHTLSKSEIKARLNALRARSLAAPPRAQQSKIDHFVVLLMENHAADNMFGCMNLTGFDGIPDGGLQLPIDAKDPSKGNVTVTCGTADYVCASGPNFDMYDLLWAKGSNMDTYPYDEQSVANAYANGATPGTTIEMFSPEQLPVKANIASEFGVFNRLFTAVPSASQPNHLFVQSATSCGATSNYLWPRCGGSTAQYPQMTIYDSMYINNVSFALYMNASCGIDGHPPCAGKMSGTPSIETPDVSMAGVARHSDRFLSQTLFYEAAANGTLPAFSWLMPPDQACDHPCHDVAKGERYVKDVYEALRAGPKWEKTLLFVVYDDGGGFFDHVPTPVGIPKDEAPCHIEPSPCSKFDFRRTGMRASAFMMSPWVGKGAVFQRPAKGNFNSSEFEETSVPATVKSLFNLTGYLTKRDEWAASFEELLLDTARTDTPMHLPTPPKPTGNWTPAPNRTDYSAGPQHCSLSTGKCLGAAALTAKQRRRIELFSLLTQTPSPDMTAMSNLEAQVYIRARWGEWIAAQRGNAL